MIGHDQRNAAQVVRSATHAADRVIAAEQVLRRNLADRQNDFRLHQLDLPLEILATGRRLVGLGSRLFGGRHLRILAMNTLSRLCPIASSI